MYSTQSYEVYSIFPHFPLPLSRNILTSFSWLAVQALAESAEAAIAPVRLGISKPLGASSVSAEYHNPRSLVPPSALRSSRQSQNQSRTLARQMHVRSALPLSRHHNQPTPSTHARAPHLPAEGIVLRPLAKGSGPSVNGRNQDPSKSQQDDSFEEMFNDGGESESAGEEEEEEEGGQERMDVSETARDGLGIFHLDNLPGVIPGGEIFLDLDTDNSDEDDYAFSFAEADDFPPLHGGLRGRGGAVEENTEEIYPFSWALDGRRFGERNPTNNRPSSPSSYVVRDL